uniref:Uncharacterized protein n=1 Tax=Lotharella oceanica TaxID=641309 RepID=A0A7S2TGZ3_9EUKA
MGVAEVLISLPWLILAPLNFIKVLINKPSPMAHYFVAKKSEECQKTCEIARMWATMFWALQFILALGLCFSQRSAPRWMFVAAKMAVGTLIIANFVNGVVLLPIGLAGGYEIATGLILLAISGSHKVKGN